MSQRRAQQLTAATRARLGHSPPSFWYARVQTPMAARACCARDRADEELEAARSYLVPPQLVGRDAVVFAFRKQLMRTLTEELIDSGEFMATRAA